MSREELYERFCIGCEQEALCHENCTTCDEFEETLEEVSHETQKGRKPLSNKVAKVSGYYPEAHVCPVCKIVVHENYNYCIECGTKLNWGER